MKNKKGFTVVELVIVIAIIAVLAAVLIPTFASVIRSAKMSSDTQLIRNLNTAIASDKNPHPTMTDVLAAAEAFGYDVSKINASVLDNEILYDSVNEVFCYYDAKAGEIKYTPKTLHPVTLKKNSYKYWRIINAENVGSAFTDISDTAATLTCGVENMNWSCYLATVKDGVTEVTTAVGVDVGNTTGLTKINYVHTSGDAQDVVIRTNSASTTLTIDDKSEGSIHHYGSAGALNIIECHTASYHEYGQVAFAEIATGRIVLESGSEIKHIHINANNEANGFDTVIIADNGAKALPEKITRDEVTVTEATRVVVVEPKGAPAETVYVYPDGSTGHIGTTEKTAEQNTEVNSALGQLVLDNGSSGDKALTEEQKEDNKEEVIEVAISEEMTSENNNYVARIGSTGYTSLESAFEAAVLEDTIVLLKDVNITSVIQIDDNDNVIFDIGNHNVTSKSDDGFEMNGGVLTINGTGYVDVEGYDFIWIHSGKAVINGGSYEGGVDCLFYNQGEIIINDGTFIGTDCIDNGATYGVNGKTTINGGEFTGSNCVIKSCCDPNRIEEIGVVGNSYENSSLAIVINNGSFDGLIRSEATYLEINGGCFTSDAGLIYCHFNSALHLNGGSFIGINDEEINSIIIGGDDTVVKTNYVGGNAIINATVAIYNSTIIENGTFNKNITLYKSEAVNPVYEVTVTGGTFGSESSSITITIYRYTSTDVTLNFFGDLKTGDTNINKIRTYDVEKSEETGLYTLNLQ